MEIQKWHELPGYKNLYESEVSLLRNGLDGDFQLLELHEPAQDGRIIAVGWLRYDENASQPVKIIFPTKYPFSQPVIIPLEFDQNRTVQTKFKLFGKGNQYTNDGSMCLMRKDQWDRRQNIGSLLRRAQRWLQRATSEQGFSKDEIVEEIPALMGHIGQVLIPKGFILPPNQKKGKMLLTQFKPFHYLIEQNVLPESPFELTLDAEPFLWYAFEHNQTFKDIFPDGNIGKLLNVLYQHFGERPEALAGKNIGLFFKADKPQWYFFKLQQLGPLNNSNRIHYLIARDIEKELYHRIKDIFDDQILATKRVTIIGLGAIGSEVARSLARNAVGHFNLFDNDTFEIGNSVRHAADLFYIGEPKVNVCKQLILRSNPNITVNAFYLDVLNDTGLLEQFLSQSDLCVVLTAEESVDYLLNELYVPKLDMPFVFARVSAGGLSGSVQVVHHGKSACLKCLSLHDADKLPVPISSRTYGELGPEYGSCSTPAVPGSEIDTKEIALQVSRISLQLLLEGKPSGYAERVGDQYYWHGPSGSENFSPFTWEVKKFEKHKNCGFCNS